MCGIAGIVRLDGASVNRDVLERMTDVLAHRGPDGRGTLIRDNVGLGHRRLSIIDLTDAASQPMLSEDGSLVLIFNGEIYNFREERSALEARGHHFRSTGDTEVLLRLYEEYGEECLSHLHGMFAFAIHDRKRGTLFLARDRVGKKPLKYFSVRGVFAFASEWKALRMLPECPREVDREAIHHFLTMMYLPSPLTGIRGVRKLPAAHALTLDLQTGHERLWRYWELSFDTDPSPSVAEWEERVRSVFTESVRLRMIADVPLGAFLSGGVDSSAVVATMSTLSDRPVKTFTIGSDDPAMNELPEASLVAKRFGTDHHEIELRADIVRLLPELVATYEEPYADPSMIPTYLVARETRKIVTVALNGDGGDENFAGYVRYPILRFSERFRRLPLPLRSLARRSARLLFRLRRDTWSYRALRFAETAEFPWERRYLQYLSFFTEEEKWGIEQQGFAEAFPWTDEWYAERTAAARARASRADRIHQAISMDIDTYLADDLMPKVDLGSMAHGLEARSPFLDHRLLELTARMPAALKIRGRQRKWLLKHLFRDILPHEILWRRKRGFRLPLDRWFRGELQPFLRERLLAPHPAYDAILDRKVIERLLDDYASSDVDESDEVWALLCFREWCELYT